MNTTLDFYLKELANPLTEFLGTIPRGKELREAMGKDMRPAPDDAVRQLPLAKRLRLNAQLGKFHVPLGRDTDVAEMILDMLEVSLSQKRPSPLAVSERIAKAKEFVLRVLHGGTPNAEAVGRCLLGPPAVGKTRTLNEVLKWIPQITVNDTKRHPLLLARTVNYVRAETPSNRKLTALASNIIIAMGAAVGENYTRIAKRGNISERLQTLAMLVMELNLGIVIIDELQHVLRKKLVPDLELTNFIVELSNTLGVPLLLVGTPQAKFAIGGALHFARRSLGPEWQPLARGSKPWLEFVNALVKYQFTQKIAPIEAIEPTLFDLSQGLPGIAVNLFQFAQKAALMLESESDNENPPTPINEEIMRGAYKRYMWTVEPMIGALRSGDPAKIAIFMDLTVDDKLVEEYLLAQHGADRKRRQKDIMKLRMGAYGSEK